MTEHSHLFTPVNEGLPKIDALYHVIIGKGMNEMNGVAYFKRNKGWMHDNSEFFKVTHWLDLSKLTTKKRAIGIAELSIPHPDTGREGCTYGDTDYDSLSVVYGYNLAIENANNNINKNKHTL